MTTECVLFPGIAFLLPQPTPPLHSPPKPSVPESTPPPARLLLSTTAPPPPMATSATLLTLDTSAGPLTLELYAAHAPRACHALASHVGRRHYHGASVAVVPGRYLHIVPATAPDVCLADVQEDAPPPQALRHVGAGVLSAWPGVPGFFVLLAPLPWWDGHGHGKGRVLGRVARGMGMVRRVGMGAGPGAEAVMVRGGVVEEGSE